jgi:3-oxoacyl-[acyl-carrier-protein] synthase II
MSAFPVAITGIGLVTPAGIGVEANWDAVTWGRATAAADAGLGDCPVKLSCRVPQFDPEALGVANPWQWDRFAQFALVATLEALRDAGFEPKRWADDSRVAVIIGSGAGGTATMEEQHAAMLEGGAAAVSPLTLPMGLLNMAAGQVAIELGARGPCFTPVTACAAGASAIGLGRELLRGGIADVVIAGGAEAPITPFYVSAFSRMRALSRNTDPQTASRPFDRARDGFVIAEGAGIFVMETADHARARGAHVHAHLAGYGASGDAHHVTQPHPEGLGAKIAMRAALEDAGLPAAEVGYVNAHGTSTPANDIIESGVIAEIIGAEVPVSSTKGVTGHLLGGAGAIEAAYAALAIEHGVIPMTANLAEVDPRIDANIVYERSIPRELRYALSNSFGFGGQNVSLLLAA